MKKYYSILLLGIQAIFFSTFTTTSAIEPITFGINNTKSLSALSLSFCSKTYSTPIYTKYKLKSGLLNFNDPLNNNSGSNINSKKQFLNTRAFKISIVPLIFFTSGAITWPYREEINDFRNRYLPNFHSSYDDYLQFAPTATVYGLYLAGVKGKHNVGRATLNYAYSSAIMAIMVNVLKSTTNVMRPDQSSNNSFPSGHTATAFSSATFLHKEYGQYRDPRYSALGYGMAVGTGVGRQTNNRHWISDVLVGAGIGILSTELGYLLAEKVHKDWGVNLKEPTANYYNQSDKPSFLQLKSGMAVSISHTIDKHAKTELNPGVSLGLEGAWFFNPKYGIGGQATFLSYAFSMSGSKVGLDQWSSHFNDPIEFQSLGSSFFLVGPYFNHQLNNYWSLSGKANFGIAVGAKGQAISKVNELYQPSLGNEQIIMEFKPGQSFGLAGDISVVRKICRTMHLKGYIEYLHSNPIIESRQIKSIDPIEGSVFLGDWTQLGKLNSHSLVFGLSFMAMLW